MDIAALRDHADEMPTAIAADLRTPQDGLFNPMKVRERSGGARAGGPSGNLGLGLYIAELIVTAHKGRIEVETSEAEGTTFTVHLPSSG